MDACLSHHKHRSRRGRPGARLAAAVLPMLPLLPTLLCACASGPARNPADPFEPLNRATYRVNDALDRNVAQPIARGYNYIVPDPVKTGVNNVFSNVGDVVVMLNDFAQLHIVDGVNAFSRVVINSTFGVLGVFDVATRGGILKHDQDFGLTLGRYGVPSGPYLVLPLFGPSTVRDAVGFGVDQYAAPTHWMDPAWRNSLWGLDFVSTRARYLDATNLLEEAALDKYLFVRDAYLGRRHSQLSAVRDETPPDYENEGGAGAAGGGTGSKGGAAGGGMGGTGGTGGAAGGGTGNTGGAAGSGIGGQVAGGATNPAPAERRDGDGKGSGARTGHRSEDAAGKGSQRVD